MAEHEVKQLLQQLTSLKSDADLKHAPQLLSRAKIGLLKLNTLVPSDETRPQHLILAIAVLEQGAIASIKLRDTDAFTRYFQQLQPFYAIPAERRRAAGAGNGNEGKVTGLYLLLLLSVGDYAGFHTVLEGLEVGYGKQRVEKDEFIQYPVRLEQALMEGSYDKVWGETKGERVPSEEFGVFSEVRNLQLSVQMGWVTEQHAEGDTDSFSVSRRFSSIRSALKSHPAPSALTRPFPSSTRRTSSSSLPKAPSSSSRSPEAGWPRMGEYTSRSKKRTCLQRRRMS